MRYQDTEDDNTQGRWYFSYIVDGNGRWIKDLFGEGGNKWSDAINLKVPTHWHQFTCGCAGTYLPPNN